MGRTERRGGAVGRAAEKPAAASVNKGESKGVRATKPSVNRVMDLMIREGHTTRGFLRWGRIPE